MGVEGKNHQVIENGFVQENFGHFSFEQRYIMIGKNCFIFSEKSGNFVFFMTADSNVEFTPRKSRRTRTTMTRGSTIFA